MPEAAASETPWQQGNLGPGRASRILFGVSYEDEQIELNAFGRPGRVCVIAAAGETAAGCAAAGHLVTAVDINPVQLDYARNRCARPDLPPVLGSAERGMNLARASLKLVAPPWRLRRLGPMLTRAEAADAQLFWETRLDKPVLRALLGATLRPSSALARVLRPEFAGFIPARFDEILVRRISAGLGRHGMRGNRFAWRLLAGQELPGWELPSGGEPIDWRLADITDHLASVPDGHYDAISLSNVFDGASGAFGNRLRAAAYRAVRPGGVIITRTFAEPGSAGAGLAAEDRSMIWGAVTVRTRR